ncbi:LIC_12616 family protein [Phascolarctobacterium sp.]|uniref:phage neck terminator protein n=1 Tax=Phascolarctobacterium sp. TaxID=2049039 RepID=UPI0038668B51
MLSRLEKYTGCTCVPSNTTKQMPAYPYISFTVINTEVRKGTYAAATDDKGAAVLFMPLLQKWSFTAQSDDEAVAFEKAMLVSDFFAEVERLYLADNGIIVADVGAITPRDNLLTIEYEYRKGLDVTIRLNNVIGETTAETIEKATLTSDTVSDIEIEKE